MNYLNRLFDFSGISWFKDLLLPIFITMVGVYLGLLVNDWQESKKDDQLKNQMITAIHQEIRENKDSLTKATTYHQLLHDSLMHWRTARLSQAELLNRGSRLFRGINPAFLKSAAFQSATTTGAAQLLPYRLYHKINAVYTLQQKLDDLNRIFLTELIHTVTAGDANSDYRTFRIITVYLADALYAEKNLLSEHNQLLSMIKPSLPKQP
jgi:hypothetical protein